MANNFLTALQRRMHLLQVAGWKVMIMWTPGHSGIQGNVFVDTVAKRAAVGVPEFVYHILTGTQLSENTLIRSGKKNGMNAVSSYISLSQRFDRTSKSCKLRRDEIVLNRLRLGHTRATHSFLFDRETERPRPLCRSCNDEPPTVQHVIWECPELDAVRADVFRRRQTSIASVLNVAKNQTHILNFMKKIDIYDEIWNMKVYILVILLSWTCIPT